MEMDRSRFLRLFCIVAWWVLFLQTPSRVVGAETASAVITSFETVPAGSFDSLETEIGTWRAGEGVSLVDDKHAKTGRQCLQLAGGETTQLTLEIRDGLEANSLLAFWAERWTSRRRFSFRIEKQTPQGWREIYNGDSQVRVGRAFLTQVKTPLGEAAQVLRFSVTSPPDTGILIDDVRLERPSPMRVGEIAVDQPTTPVLIRNPANAVLRIAVDAEGMLDPIRLQELSVKFAGTQRIDDIERVEVYSTGDRGVVFGHAHANPFADATRIAAREGTPAESVKLACDAPLQPGKNYFWISCTLRDTADADARIDAACSELQFSDGSQRKVVNGDPPGNLRIGYALRQAADDQVHTYRIPGLATTNQGTLIGVYDVRRRSGGDLPGDIDVGMSRSTDGGRTWEPMKVVMDMGHNPRWRYDGIGDPAVLSEHGIDTVHALPGVGKNLQDHLQIRAMYKVQGIKTLNDVYYSPFGKLKMGMDYFLFRNGPMTAAPSQMGVFARTSPEFATANVEYHMQPLTLDSWDSGLHRWSGFTASVCNLRPTSRGTVHISSREAGAQPDIRANYLSTPEDRKVAADSLRLTRHIVSQPALAPFRPEEYKPGPGIETDEELAKAAGDIGTTIFHPVGTAKMGTDDDRFAVTDERLRVRGVSGLRVVDASVMPTITSGNTNSPTMMIATKAARMILEDAGA